MLPAISLAALVLAPVQYTDFLPRQTIPDTAPIYCYNSLTKSEPLVGIDFGMFRRAFLDRFAMRAQAYASGESSGVLRFRSKWIDADTVTFDVAAGDGDRGPGVLLMRMRAEATTIRGEWDGNTMCWMLFGLVNDR